MTLRTRLNNYMTSKILRKKSGISNFDLGFTLTEILVSMIIAGLIMSGLMSLMVELVTSDARENSRNETQREMQMALDYISSDIRESVYVYDGNCLEGEDPNGNCSGFVDEIAVENSVPILAFWKLEDLPTAAANNCGPGIPDPELEFPCLSGRSYSLIIYYLTRNEEGNGTWSGLGRIRRARLAQFNTSTGEPTGLIPPYGIEGVSFQKWTFSEHGSGLDIRPITLVDFVDSRPMSEIAAQQEGVDQLTVTCPPSHIKTPSDNTLNQINNFTEVRNFYACIRDDSMVNDDDEDQTQAFNQKVILFLRGNAAGKPGIRDANIGFMPAIQTQVLNRSVRQKRPRTF